MAHKMGLVKVSMSAHNVYDNLVYDGNSFNSVSKTWTVSSYGTYTEWNGSTTFTSSDKPLVSGTNCYQIVKPNVTTLSYATSTVEASHKYAWNQDCVAITTAGQYETYDVDYDVDFIAATWLFSYSGSGQQWEAPKAGIFSFECWGASGGTDKAHGTAGRGAYTYGRTTLSKGNAFFVYVGEVGVPFASSPTTGGGGWNGGGWGSSSTYDSQTPASGGYHCTGGGGATDIRLIGNTNSTWNVAAHLLSRVMVAAGGGGYEHYSLYSTSGGYAGGLTGGSGTSTNSSYASMANSGATQTGSGNYYEDNGPGYFGYGSIGEGHGWGGGGGSGYFGGIKGYGQGGSGGSSYISGHAGCVARNAAGTGASTAGSANSVERSKHSSGRYFTSTRMVDGEGKAWTTSRASTATGMPKTSGSGTENGHLGNGYARIIYIPN
jgi:hypothetical protein